MKKFLLTTMTAILLVVYGQVNAQTWFSDDFNDLDISSDWTIYDQDGDTWIWEVTQFVDDFGFPAGTPVMNSRSWDYITGDPLTPDNWAVSPAIDLTSVTPGTDVFLTYKVCGVDPLYSGEHYGVYAATSNTIAALTAAGELFGEGSTSAPLPGGLDNMANRTVDLSSFAGQTVYVAFRHYNSFDQFVLAIDDVKVSSPQVCDGSAVSGVTVNATASPVTVSWDPQSNTDHYVVQYKKVSDATWIDVTPNPTTNSATLPTLSVGTYEVRVATVCTTTQGTFSTPVQFIVDYCAAGATTYTDEYIGNVTFADINNPSVPSTGGYENFTGIIGHVNAGSTYPFSATAGGNSYTSDQVVVWIDYNQDGDFDDAGEKAMASGQHTSPWIGNISIPSTATLGDTRMRVRLDYANAAGNNPCGTTSYGQVEDYTLNIGAPPSIPPDCTGFAVTSPANTSTIPGGLTTITWPAVATASGYRVYLGTTAAGGEINDGSTPITGTSYTVSLPANDHYYLRVVPTNIAGDATGCPGNIEFDTDATLTYCTPGGTNSSYYINDFTTTGGSNGNNISNTGTGFSSGGYGDYYATQDVSQAIGGTVNFTANMSSSTYGFRIWIDWNQDGTFDTTNEVAYSSAGYLNVHNGSFVVPATALAGDTRMRIGNSYLQDGTGPADPCNPAFIYGEYEDYKFTVDPLPTDAPDCTGFEITSPTNQSILQGGQVTITWTPATDAFGYHVKVGTTIGGGEAFDDDVTGTSQTVTVAANTIYYVGVTPYNNMGNAACTAVILFQTDDTPVYCTPGGTNSAYYVNDFTTTGGGVNISNLGTGFSPGGYGNYYATHTASQYPGGSVDFTTNIVTSGSAGFKIWIDWNQDGTFDNSAGSNEIAYASSSYLNTHTGSFTVPANAVMGDTRMRIGSSYIPNSGPPNPCDPAFTYGEFEDYKFNVFMPTVAPACTTITSPANGAILSAGNATITWNAVPMAFGYHVTVGTTPGGSEVFGGDVTGTSQTVVVSADSHYYVCVTPFNNMGNATGCSSSCIEFDTDASVACGDSFNGAFDNAPGVTGGYMSANDFFVPTGTTVSKLNSITVLMVGLANSATDFASFDVSIMTDSGSGTPGTELNFYSGITPTSVVLHSQLFAGYNTYEVTLDLGGFPVDGSPTADTRYWIGLAAYSATSQFIYWTGYVYSGPPSAQAYQSLSGGTWDPVENDNTLAPTDCIWSINASCSTLAVDDPVAKSDLAYYPNPVKDVLNISSKQGVESVEIYGVAGQKVMSVSKVSNGQVNMSRLPAGVYIVTAKLANGQAESFKVIKE
ncbi:MAG: GEVED domain-containing protein [Flavobacteriaceae bacterium]|jgi:hypothetical protein|nr:GEVED domain-containing protein [Flavobacteriaceae bacterium]